MRCIVAVLALALAIATSSATGSTTPTRLRLDGIGPLHLGMTRQAALATGWLAHRSPGCELAGPPRPIAYRVNGPNAPKGVLGTAEFTGNRLRALAFTGGVMTAVGIEVGHSTAPQMVTRYRAAGFTAGSHYDATFQETFVTVRRGGRQRIGGLAEHETIDVLAIPAVTVCE